MSASMHPDAGDELLRSARSFFPQVDRCTPLGDSTGFSGSRFARVEAAGAVWCLRRWPDDRSLVRLRAIHRVLRHSRSRGFHGVPALARLADGATILVRDSALYDLQGWLPGEPLDGPLGWSGSTPNGVYRLQLGRLAELAVMLARFHRSTAALAMVPGLPTQAIGAEFAALVEGLPGRCATLSAAAGQLPAGAGRTLARRWLQLLPQAVAGAARAARRDMPEAPGQRVICHGDLWARHVYAVGRQFSGFVDFESLAWGSPAVDLAQLLLHFAGWQDRSSPYDARHRRAAPVAAKQQPLR